MKILILDSGIRKNHPIFNGHNLEGYSLKYIDNEKKVLKTDDFEDKIGHGTAIYSIVKKKCNFSQIKMIKIFEDTLSISENEFYHILEYIYMNEDADIINMSLGINICIQHNRLYELTKKITNKGTIIVSAFDNNGSISFPAAFENVIGVDGSRYISSDSEYELLEDSIINIRTKGTVSRVAWINPDYIVTNGNSFSCAYATTIIAREINENKFNLHRYINLKNCNKERDLFPKFKINKAAIFPFNKEMHSIIRFNNLLSFELMDIYDSKYSGRVGASVCRILNDYNIQDRIIKDINCIEWETIDTLILGHLDELEILTRNARLKMDLIKLAFENNVNIYCFDTVEFEENPHIYFPKISEVDIPKNRFGKLYRNPKPILGVFGTSSSQGKFTLQLSIREQLIKLGYKVGQLGTEPSSLLYNMDYVFPFGYNNTVNISSVDYITVLNNKLQNISQSGCDIIIVGSQSGTIPYDTSNTAFFPINQIAFLYGTLPDAVILAVNFKEDIDYIRRTINFIESSVDTKIIALSLFPMKFKENFAGFTGSKERVQSGELLEMKNKLKNEFDLPVFILREDIENLIDTIIDFFEG